MTTALDTSKEMYRAGYAPSPEIPEWFERRLAEIGGRTLDGRPKLRVVWGMDARGWPWPDNEAPKYISPNDPLTGWACFILEQYVDPSFFGDPAEWEKARWTTTGEGNRVATMAPFPSRGEYIFVMPLATPAGTPLPLTEGVADFVAQLMRATHDRPHNSYTQQTLIAERLKRITDAREERRRETDAELDRIYDEAATKAAATDARQTREWNRLPADALAKAARFLRGTKNADSASH